MRDDHCNVREIADNDRNCITKGRQAGALQELTANPTVSLNEKVCDSSIAIANCHQQSRSQNLGERFPVRILKIRNYQLLICLTRVPFVRESLLMRPLI